MFAGVVTSFRVQCISRGLDDGRQRCAGVNIAIARTTCTQPTTLRYEENRSGKILRPYNPFAYGQLRQQRSVLIPASLAKSDIFSWPLCIVFEPRKIRCDSN